MHIVSVIVTVKPDTIAEFEAALLMNARASVEKDPGCVRFDVSQSYDDPAVWILYEVYTSKEAHAAHKQAPHFLAYNEVAERAIVKLQRILAAGKFLKG